MNKECKICFHCFQFLSFCKVEITRLIFFSCSKVRRAEFQSNFQTYIYVLVKRGFFLNDKVRNLFN